MILLTYCQSDNASLQVRSSDTAAKSSPRKPIDISPIYGKGEADISIKIKNGEPDIYYLIGTFGDQVFKVDSSSLSQEGIIRFQNPDGLPQGHYYVTMPRNSHIQLLIGENQKINISLDAFNINNSLKSDDIENTLLYETSRAEALLAPQFDAVRAQLQHQTVGSAAHTQALQQQQTLTAERKAILQKVFDSHPNSLFAKFKMAGQNPDLRVDLDEQARIYAYRHDFWANVDFSDARLLRTPVIANKMKRYMSELTPQIPDSVTASAIQLIDKSLPFPIYFQYFANWLPINYEPTKTTLMDPEMVYCRIVQKYFTFEHAFWADSTYILGLQRRAAEMAGSLLGQIGPDVVANDVNGKTQSIGKLTQDYIIIYMFSPDCEHCREETPKLIQWYQSKKTYSAEVFAIGVKTTDSQWRDYVKSSSMPWINVYDETNRAIYGKYFVDITPEIYVLNPARKIIAKNIKTFQIDQVIKQDQGKAPM